MDSDAWLHLGYALSLAPLAGLYFLAQASYTGVCVPWRWRVVIVLSYASLYGALYATSRGGG